MGEIPITAMETLHFDVIIVGAGPAGLATACHLRTLGAEQGRDLAVCVLEKGARVGSHLLSGALLDPRALAALVPEWAEREHGEDAVPLESPVLEESLWLLTPERAHPLPLPRGWRHDHCRMVSLGNLCRWLARRATQQGVEIFPGFAAAAPLWEGERLVGVVSGPLGLDQAGQPKAGFQPGISLRAPITVLAEGCRGFLSGQIIHRLGLATPGLANKNRSPQRYAIGIKELWETPGSRAGAVLHTLGWPLDAARQQAPHGGGFLYQPRANRTALGLVVDLNYKNPLFDPFLALQQWKNHPMIAPRLRSARLLGYGARTLSVGGWQSLPQMAFAGGLLVGDSAGLLNTATFQGIGNGLAAGRLAAETILAAFGQQDFSGPALQHYTQAVLHSPWGRALRAVRNVRPGFAAGLWPGLLNALWEKSVAGNSPWTFRWRRQDRDCLQAVRRDHRPTPSPELVHPTLDRATALACSGLHYEADQPVHLRLRDPDLPLTTGLHRFANPELRFCPAAVFAVSNRSDKKKLFRMHANHCLHCKCCDIKDPLDNIYWTLPQGGSGPDYQDM
ncbi:MAG: 4Fe-4S dicluster domain-containing protein [Magnetococcales bacterium]|nr:4Fe-4S dicluster domain-containing protein [Magnetococcales bacterium]